MDVSNLKVVKGDLINNRHREALVELIEIYMKGNMGEGGILNSRERDNLILGLSNHPAALIFFGECEDRLIGLATCFIGFSTFYAKKLINIHDLIVLPEYRNCGVAKRILSAIEAKAKELNCCKITLEVRNNNVKAMRLYTRLGFGGGKHPMYFWTKLL